MSATKPYRVRIIGYQEVEARYIYPSPHNWRLHLDPQRDAMTLMLEKLGIIAAVILRVMGKNKYELIDGHLRDDLIGSRQKVPSLITDLTNDEARTAISVFDPLSAMAGQDSEKLSLNLKFLEKQGDTISKAVFPDFVINPLMSADWSAGKPGDMPDRDEPGKSHREVQPVILTKKERKIIDQAVGKYIKAHPEHEDESEGFIVAQICKAFTV